MVSAAEHETVIKAYDAAQATIAEKDTKLEELEELIGKLKECKDKSEVTAVMHQTLAFEETFERLTGEFKSLTRDLPSVAVEAMYYHSDAEVGRAIVFFSAEAALSFVALRKSAQQRSTGPSKVRSLKTTVTTSFLSFPHQEHVPGATLLNSTLTMRDLVS